MSLCANFNGQAVYDLLELSSLAGIEGLNPSGGTDVPCDSCVLSDRGLCDGLIPRPEESYQL